MAVCDRDRSLLLLAVFAAFTAFIAVTVSCYLCCLFAFIAFTAIFAFTASAALSDFSVFVSPKRTFGPPGKFDMEFPCQKLQKHISYGIPCQTRPESF